jgi:phage shock protein A
MGILDRIGLIVKSNVNAALDKATNPEVELNGIMYDMQDSMKQLDKEVGDQLARAKMFEMNANDARRRAQEWDAKAQTAVRAGRDDLATEALRQKMQSDRDVESFERQALEIREMVDKMRGSQDELKKKYSELEQNKSNLIARANMAKQSQKVMGTRDPVTGLSDSAYDRMQGKILREQVRAEMDEDQLRAATAEHELNKLTQEATLEDELAALKNRMGNKPKTSETPGQSQTPPNSDPKEKPYDEK